MRAYPAAVSIERERAEARRRAREAEAAAAAVRRRAPWPAAREVRRRWSPPPRYWLATTVRAEKRKAAREKILEERRPAREKLLAEMEAWRKSLPWPAR